MDLLTLRSGETAVQLAPSAGGAITRYWLERDGVCQEWLRPTPPAALAAGDPFQAAAFPLVPYSNRIREGRFGFGRREVALPLNRPPERHAIHGHGWQARWEAVDVGPVEARLQYRHAASDWPWAYRATQRFTLTPSGLTVELTLTNESDGAMPAGLGWHPYFPRTPRATLTANVEAIWLTDAEMMPTTLALPPPVDLARGIAVDTAALDNCFTGWRGRAVIEWPERAARLVMTAAPSLGCLVVFTPPGRPFFCAEPVSHVTDAFNLAAAGRADTGALTLEPGETLAAAISLSPAC